MEYLIISKIVRVVCSLLLTLMAMSNSFIITATDYPIISVHTRAMLIKIDDVDVKHKQLTFVVQV